MKSVKRASAHFQKKEPPLETILRLLRYRKVAKFIPIDALVLDIGCGYEGDLLRKLSPIISKGVGIDLSVTKDIIRKNIFLKKCSADKKLPFPDNQFNIVAALALIEHVNDPKKFLSESLRVLKKGGVLLLTTPSRTSKPILEFLAFKVGAISKREIEDHKKYYTKSSLYKELTKAGFEKDKIIITSFELGLNLFAKTTK